MLFSAVLLISCMWTSTLAGNDSSALNATLANVSTNSTTRIPSMIFSHLPKAIRTKGNHTLHTTSIPHSKVKVTSVDAKHNKVMAANTTTTSKLDATTLPATVRNLKNGDHRSNSSRLMDRFASISKVSLASLASSKISNAANKTSTPRNERASVNITMAELKNATDQANRTIAKRSVHNSTVVDRASSFFQKLPVVLVNTTSNVTSWVRSLFSPANNASTNATTKKVTRDTNAAELKSLVNSSQTSKSSVNLTVESREKSSNASGANEDEKSALGNTTSILNLTSVTIKRDTGNLTADVPSKKESNSSLANATNDEIKRDTENSEGSLHRLNVTSLPQVAVDDVLPSTKLNDETSEAMANASLVSKSLDLSNNRTRRHNNPFRYGRPAPPQYMMPITTTPAPSYQGYPTSAPYRPAAPVYGKAPAAPVYGMTPTTAAPSYGMAPAGPGYGMTPTTAVPAYGMAPAAAPVCPCLWNESYHCFSFLRYGPCRPCLRNGSGFPFRFCLWNGSGFPFGPCLRNGSGCPFGPCLRNGSGCPFGPCLRNGSGCPFGPCLRNGSGCPFGPCLRNGSGCPFGLCLRNGSGPCLRNGSGCPSGPCLRNGSGFPSGPCLRNGSGCPSGPCLRNGSGFPSGPCLRNGSGCPSGPCLRNGSGFPSGPCLRIGSGCPFGPCLRNGSGCPFGPCLRNGCHYT
ncbi:sialidase isoform X2 [Daphnia magna]|uniref:sialidase isoform X2 n=1 Tax=Daphnia magna TaxID=35525 RepID=UPI001E1BD16D|nr:sialidase isoform X2 [Daphnia magna]